jgi:ketol-acid reductoisomerase
MAWTESHKFHMQHLLKIVYEKAAETDEQYMKDYEKIVQQIDEKVNMFADEWIKNMNDTLGHKTEYQNWKEATRYIEKLLKANKNGSERS